MIFTESQRAFLDQVQYAVVGTLNRDGSIQQTVVWYIREGDELRFSLGATSVKARNLGSNATITLTVTNGGRYLSVSGVGSLEPADSDLRLRLATRYLGAEQAQAWISRPEGNVVRATVRINPRRLYGQGV
jgi:PPOX class probable F420-dependent enzyme